MSTLLYVIDFNIKRQRQWSSPLSGYVKAEFQYEHIMNILAISRTFYIFFLCEKNTNVLHFPGYIRKRCTFLYRGNFFSLLTLRLESRNKRY